MKKVYINNTNTYLSPKEINVLKYIIEGFDNIEIAKIMGVSVHTIKAHVSVIIRKFEAKNRTHAACIAIQSGFIKKLN